MLSFSAEEGILITLENAKAELIQWIKNFIKLFSVFKTFINLYKMNPPDTMTPLFFKWTHTKEEILWGINIISPPQELQGLCFWESMPKYKQCKPLLKVKYKVPVSFRYNNSRSCKELWIFLSSKTEIIKCFLTKVRQ
jgi:hypothetical protein